MPSAEDDFFGEGSSGMLQQKRSLREHDRRVHTAKAASSVPLQERLRVVTEKRSPWKPF